MGFGRRPEIGGFGQWSECKLEALLWALPVVHRALAGEGMMEHQ